MLQGRKKQKGPGGKMMPHEHKKREQKSIENGAWRTQNEARMHHKWSQNREKCIESPKVATR